jgi:hypothetical protein
MGRFQYSLRHLIIAAAIMPPLIYLGILAVPSLAMRYFPSDVSPPPAKLGTTGPWFDAKANLEAVKRNRLHLAAWCAAAVASLAVTVVVVADSRKKRRAGQLLEIRARHDLDWLTGIRPR